MLLMLACAGLVADSQFSLDDQDVKDRAIALDKLATDLQNDLRQARKQGKGPTHKDEPTTAESGDAGPHGNTRGRR